MPCFARSRETLACPWTNCWRAVETLAARGDKVALLFEGDDPAESYGVTYRDLYERVCRFANALRGLGVGKGDRVTIYMPMIPEAAVAMLACARIGAVHSVVFGGFSAQSVADRIQDSQARLVITADGGFRRGAVVPLKIRPMVTPRGSSPG